jgi:mono/diheme cytochrome c family protein
VSLPRSGSPIALAQLDGKVLAYVADEDDAAVHVVDVDAKADLGTTRLAGKPSALMFLRDGRLVVVLRDQAQLVVLEPGPEAARPPEMRCALPTDAEPVGLAVSPDDAELVVTSAWGRSLASYDVRSAAIALSWQVALPREPRAVVVSDDGTKAFVAQAVGGQMSIVDLRARRVLPVPTHWPSSEGARRMGTTAHEKGFFRTQSCQGFALAKTEDPRGRVLLPQALVDPGVLTERPSGYGGDDHTAEAGDVAVVDGSTGDVLRASLLTGSEADPCLLPRSAAYDAKRRSLLVGCFGIDAVVAYDATAASPVRAQQARWHVASGPAGIAVDPPRDRAIVWSQFERVVDVLPLAIAVDEKGSDKPPPVARIALAPSAQPKTLAAALGRILFHRGDDRISADGRACASCHPDGRDDGLTWSTPNGPRRTMMLAGRVDASTPFSWSGSEHSFEDHVGITFARLRGRGLNGVELDALTEYVATLAPPPGLPGESNDQVARGEKIFRSEDTGCSSCHSGGRATDNLHHTVQSKTQADRSGNFNTPSLRFVGGGGPYYHDGRYATLHQLLTDGKRKMGNTTQLTPAEIDALEAYLRTL